MKKRLASLEKVKRLQAQLHDLTVWKLAAIEQTRDSLAVAQREMIEAIDRDTIGHGVIVAAATRRLRAIGKEIALAEAEHQAQSRRVVEQGARAKLAERLVADAGSEYRQQTERKDLSDLIERSVGGKGSSSA